MKLVLNLGARKSIETNQLKPKNAFDIVRRQISRGNVFYDENETNLKRKTSMS